MNRTKLKNYAPRARREFIKAVTDRAALFGLTKKEAEPITVEGDVAIIGGNAFPRSVEKKRRRLEETIERDGFDHVMEAAAYTWFNRLLAIRYMELHGYLDHGYRVLSHPEGRDTPEIVQHAEHVNLPGLKTEQIIDLRLDATKEAELYRLLLVAQCNALHKAMPFLFERIDDETELLLPDNLLHSDSLVRQLVQEIPEEDWREVEIIGWLYQFYISEKKAQVIGKVVSSEDIPAATQLFTPNWIVQYLVQNSIGRQWLATYPSSPLRDQMDYYIEPAEQTPEVQAQLDEITPGTLDPERMTLLDPACGSGHILVEAYDLFKAIYLERGYRAREIPRLILRNNLFGLEIDERAAQLASFALLMKARADDRRVWEGGIRLNVHCIRSSDGLDAEAVYDALVHGLDGDADDEPPRGEFEFMEEVHSPLMAEAKKDRAAVAEDSEDPGFTADDIRVLLDLFEGDKAKTFGSLIRIPAALAAKLPAMVERAERVAHGDDFYRRRVAEQVLPIAEQGQVLGQRYDAVVANPPYMGRKGQNASIKSFASDEYLNSKSDLFAMFIERGFELATPHRGHNAMVTMQSWMFLSSYQAMRQSMLEQSTFTSMVHLGPRAFREISGEVVTVTAFCSANMKCTGYRPAFFRLVEGDDKAKRAAFAKGSSRHDSTAQGDFTKIPGSPIAYWVSDHLRKVFESAMLLSEIATPRQGCATSDNNRFLRMWHEVPRDHIGLRLASREAALESEHRWFPYNKGGSYRKWSGNYGHVVNWERDGKEIMNAVADKYPYLNGNVDYVVKNRGCYFRECVSWSKITSGGFALRHYEPGFVFDVSGCSIFSDSTEELEMLLGCMNSPVMTGAVNALSPTLNFEVGQVAAFPVMPKLIESASDFSQPVQRLIEIARADWDAFETSWDFTRNALVAQDMESIEAAFDQMVAQADAATREMQQVEQQNNRQFIEAYGLSDELGPEVPLGKVTLTANPVYRYGSGKTDEEYAELQRTDTIEELLSYAIGCLMGRYSLDKPGLIYAHSGNEGFDPSQYRTFPADGDGIVPITDFDWFEDDAANRVVQFIATAWPAEHLEENLDFVADSLERKRGESARDRVRRYLSRQFFKDHLRTYKKRPIYWLFSSGKQRAFQALVYLHRYNESTLSRMRIEYVIPLQGKMASRLEFLQRDATHATSASHRKKVEKEIEALRKQHQELLAFDEKVRHYADKRIKLDLDDGVKVNYGKFGDLLADVKAVTGKKPEVT